MPYFCFNPYKNCSFLVPYQFQSLGWTQNGKKNYMDYNSINIFNPFRDNTEFHYSPLQFEYVPDISKIN